MLLLNLNIHVCNGTRSVIAHLMNNLIIAQVISGISKDKNISLPKIKLNRSDDELPFEMIIKGFPIGVAYSMTINKSSIELVYI